MYRLSIGSLAVLLAFTSVAVGEPPARLMTARREAAYRASFPQLADAEWQAVIDAEDLILYDEETVPPAYQNDPGGFVSIYHNPAGRRLDPVGNANRELPWATAAGTQAVPNLEVVRMIKLPKRPGGGHWPIVWWEAQLKMTFFKEETNCIRWLYPKGTVFGELLMQKGPDGRTYPFEMRFRERYHDSWDVAAFRPFPEGKALVKRIKELRPDWANNPTLARFVRSIELNWKFPTEKVADKNPNKQGFSSNKPTFKLPPLDDDQLVTMLLTSSKWENAAGESWNNEVEAPTATKSSGFSIVPTGYKAHAFSVDADSCMRCHEHTNHACRLFDIKREWYGRVRGSDGIFSFHPIAPKAISLDGVRKPVEMRESLVKAGLVQEFAAKLHPDEIYHQLSTMKE